MEIIGGILIGLNTVKQGVLKGIRLLNERKIKKYEIKYGNRGTSVYNMSTSRVYIGRLPSRATRRDVERFFRGFGRIRDVVLKNGFGFVVSAQVLTKGKSFHSEIADSD